MRRLTATAAEVFDACTDPHLLALWFGPRAFDVCDVDADVRVGGRFRFRMSSAAKGVYGAEGTYREVTPPSRLVLTWKWTEAPPHEELDDVESLVTFDIRPDGRGTVLTLTHEQLPDDQSAESHHEGWTEALDKLEALLASQARTT